MESSLSIYFRCPEESVQIVSGGPLSSKSGYFRFGNSTLYGRLSDKSGDVRTASEIRDVTGEAHVDEGRIQLPFDLTEVVENSQREAYAEEWRNGAGLRAGRRIASPGPAIPDKLGRSHWIPPGVRL